MSQINMHADHHYALGIQTLFDVTSLTLMILTSEGQFADADFESHDTADMATSASKGMHIIQDGIGDTTTTGSSIANTSFNGATGIHMNISANVSEVRSMCPGAVEFYMNQTDPAVYPVKVTDCKAWPSVYDVRFQHHWVYGQCRNVFFCRVIIQVPSNMIVRARFEYVPRDISLPLSAYSWALYVYENITCKHCKREELSLLIQGLRRLYYLANTNQIYLYYRNRPPVRIIFEAVERRLDVRYTSDTGGFVTAWYEEGVGRVCDQLTVPFHHVIMISFDSDAASPCSPFLTLHCVASDTGHKVMDELSKNRFKFIKIYHTKQLEVCLHMRGAISYGNACFKVLFSFHPEHRVPQRLSSGLFNCSTEDYWRFQQHLDCNIQVDCEDERDEAGHCPYSSPACNGWVSAQNKCFRLFQFESTSTLPRIYVCRALGFELASLKTEQEIDGALKLVKGRIEAVCFGLTCGLRSKRNLYGSVFMWSDNTAVYNTDHLKMGPIECRRSKAYTISFIKRMSIIPARDKCSSVLCEANAGHDVFVSKSVESSHSPVSQFTFQQLRQMLVICPGGHVTHAFLLCDPKCRCGQHVCRFFQRTNTISEVVSLAQNATDIVTMYSCSSVDTEVSYSLLCDFRQDCADNSDESFCHHPACTEFTCTSGQCVSMSTHCDMHMDCLDDSDEQDCPVSRFLNVDPPKEYEEYRHTKRKSFLINFDGRGYFSQREINLTDPCPDTHYRCTKGWFHCLPIYTRCNGVFDCIFHEDERECESRTCSGLYRCRGSAECLHADHMCDGWPQCPQRDDEWLCNMTCPTQCLCQGHAFLCSRPFPSDLFPLLRYLDAGGSGMTPSDLRNNTYMIRLSLVQCYISSLSDMKFPNLKFLDLSYNKLINVLMNIFVALPNLQLLTLKGNPLTSVTTNPSNKRQHLLQKIDLSETNLTVLDSEMLSKTPEIRYINISHSTTRSIRPHSLEKVPHLREIDMRENMVDDFPASLFRGLNDLANVYASDYRFCCDEILPNIAPKPRCLAPDHYLSSCDNMIRSGMYRLTFWVVAVLASLGNIVCFVCHCVKTSVTIPYGGAVVVFMVSLQCADFCMGLYATVVTAAQQTFSGEYIHYGNTWKESVACSMAGFLSLLSSEMSIVMILFLSLDHFTSLCFPLSMYRFSHRSAIITCGVTWFVGILLTSMSLLPGLFHFGHYGQTALCSLMLRDKRCVNRDTCFLHTISIFNMLVCIMACVTQVFVFRAVPRNQVLIDPEQNPVLASVNLVMRIGVTHVARWIPIIATYTLSSAGKVGPEVEVFMAVMVLPLSSAVNPLMCLWHAVAYKQKQIQQQRLLNVMKSRRKLESNVPPRNWLTRVQKKTHGYALCAIHHRICVCSLWKE